MESRRVMEEVGERRSSLEMRSGSLVGVGYFLHATWRVPQDKINE